MKIINNRFEIVHFLGKGNYGTTYKAIDRKTNEEIALKIVDLNFLSRKKNYQLTEQFKILSYVSHPFIIKPFFIDQVYTIDSYPFLQKAYFYTMPFINKAITVNEYFIKHKNNEKNLLSILLKICSAINHLHSYGIAHNDIQKYNILVRENHLPVVLDVFPINLEKDLYSIDYKNLHSLITELNLPSKKLHQALNYFEKSNYNFDKFRNFILKSIDEKDYAYFYSTETRVDSSLFHLQPLYEKIIQSSTPRNLLINPNREIIQIFSRDFYNLLKSQDINTVFVKDLTNLEEFLQLSEYSVKNEKDSLFLLLRHFLIQHNLNIVFPDFYQLDASTRSFIYYLLKDQEFNSLKLYIFSSRQELSLKPYFKKHIVSLSQEHTQQAIQRYFNFHKLKFEKFPLFNDPVYIIRLIEVLAETKSKGKLFTKAAVREIFDKLYIYYVKQFKLDRLSKSEKLILYIFYISSPSVSIHSLFTISYKGFNPNEIARLLQKNIILVNESRTLSLHNQFLKNCFYDLIYVKNKSFYDDFGLYFLKNNHHTPLHHKTYLELIRSAGNLKLLADELCNFYNTYPIYEYSDLYKNIYEMIFLIPIGNLSADRIQKIVLDYYYYNLILLSRSNLEKLSAWIKKLRENHLNTQTSMFFGNICFLIELAVIFIDYDLTRFKLKFNEFDAGKIQNTPYFVNQLFYLGTLSGWKEISKKYKALLFSEHLFGRLNSVELLLFFFALSHATYRLTKSSYFKYENFEMLTYMVYYDALCLKNIPIAGKGAHNLAYITERLDEKNVEKAMHFYEEAIQYYSRHKIYGPLSLTYNNLAILTETKEPYSPKIKNYYELSLYYAKKSSTRSENVAFISINLMVKYFDHFEFSKYKKLNSELQRFFIEEAKLNEYLRFIDLEIFFNSILGNLDSAGQLIQEGEKLIVSANYPRFHDDFIAMLFFHNLIIGNKELLDKNFQFYYPKAEFKSNILHEYLLISLYFHLIYNKPLDLPQEFHKLKINKKTDNELASLAKSLKAYIRTEDKFHLKQYLYDFIRRSKTALSPYEEMVIFGALSFFDDTGDLIFHFLNYCRVFYNSLPKNWKNDFFMTPLLKKLFEKNHSVSREWKNKKSLEQQITRESSKYPLNLKILNTLFKKISSDSSLSLMERFKILARFLMMYSKITYISLYSIDNSYNIKREFEYKSLIFPKVERDLMVQNFDKFVSSGQPIVETGLPNDIKSPNFFALIPVLSYESDIKRHSSSFYYLEAFSYFFHIESRHLVNPFWNADRYFFAFLSDMLSYISKFNDTLLENLYDPLTNVLVRNAFLKRSKNILQKIKKGTLFFIDIDNFKQINDIFGHHFGDEVLSQIAQAIKNSVRKNDLIGRYGGEEFIVFIPYLDFKDSQYIAERIRSNIHDKNIIKDRKLSATIGVSVFPQDSMLMDILILKAEIANRHGKKKGKNIIVKYNKNLENPNPEDELMLGIISRDPIKTTENIKSLIRIIDHSNYFHRHGKEMTQTQTINDILSEIKKIIYFDLFYIKRGDHFITNIKNKNFLKTMKSQVSENIGITNLYSRIFHYMTIAKDDITLFFGNYKNYAYNEELQNLAKLYLKILENII